VLKNKVLDSKSKRKERLIQRISHLEKEAGKLRNALKRILGDREYGTAVTLITDTEDGSLYACTYRTAKGVHCHSLTRIDRMGKDGCTVDSFCIPLVESVPTAHRNGLKGYCRLGGSETFVPQYLSLERSHLRAARAKNTRKRKEIKYA